MQESFKKKKKNASGVVRLAYTARRKNRKGFW